MCRITFASKWHIMNSFDSLRRQSSSAGRREWFVGRGDFLLDNSMLRLFECQWVCLSQAICWTSVQIHISMSGGSVTKWTQRSVTESMAVRTCRFNTPGEV